MAGLIAKIEYNKFNLNLNVNLNIKKRSTVILLGKSGVGKTTLLRCICGLEIAHKAYIECNNNIWHNSDSNLFIKTHKRSIGYVSQKPNLFPHLSVKDNLLFGHQRIAKNNIELSYDEVSTMLNTKYLLSRSCENLSGGEQQRVNLGRALLTNPDLLLLDEPISALDKDSAEEVLHYIENICSKISIPIILVTHNIDQELILSKKHYVLENGCIHES